MASTGLSYAPMVKGDSVVENDTEFDVLFIGNSMTYYNNLHKMVEGIASKRGHDINCTAVT